MDVRAVAKYQRLSPSKARDFARRLRGLSVAEALLVTETSSRKAAVLLSKTLKSAIANAETNAKLSVDELRVKEAVIGEGPKLRRFWPRARGGVSRIAKRTCHVSVVLTDGRDEEQQD